MEFGNLKGLRGSNKAASGSGENGDIASGLTNPSDDDYFESDVEKGSASVNLGRRSDNESVLTDLQNPPPQKNHSKSTLSRGTKKYSLIMRIKRKILSFFVK